MTTNTDQPGAAPEYSGQNFGTALSHLKAGNHAAREGWNGKGMHLELAQPCKEERSTLPYIVMRTACGNRVPWLASQTDLLAEDWIIYTFQVDARPRS